MANESQKEVLDLQKQLADVLQSINSLLAEFVLKQKEIKSEAKETNEVYKKSLEQEYDFKKVLDELSVSLNKQLIKYEAITEQRKKAELLERERIGLAEQELEGEKAILEVLKKRSDTYESLKKHLIKKSEELEKQKDLNNISNEEYKNELLLIAEENSELTKLSEIHQQEIDIHTKKFNIQKATSGIFDQIVGKIGFTSNANKTWLGLLSQSLSSAQNMGFAFSHIKNLILDFVNPTNIFYNALTKVATATKDMVKAMDFQFAALEKTTGASDKYKGVIDDVRFGSLQAGIGFKQSTDALNALFINLSKFSQMNVQAQTELVRTVALLERMGISANITAKNIDISTKALGMNVAEAITAQKEIAAVALELGISPGMLAEQFTASLPQLAQYGKQSIQIFKELASQTKATGIAVNELIGIAQQFDTFEGAATAAGKLNAILGENLINSVDLLAASESERIDMLRESIAMSNRSYDSMGKFEKMALANAAGIRDMSTANKLFGTTAEEFEKVNRAKEADALSTAKLTEHASKATAAQEKLVLMMEALTGAALPLFEMFASLINVFLKVSDMAGGVLGPALIGFTGTIYIAAKALFALKAAGLITGITLQAAFWPVTLIALAIAALSAGIYLLYKHFDTINAVIQEFTGGIFDGYDLLLNFLGPIGLVIIGIRKLVENWDSITDSVYSFVLSVKDIGIQLFQLASPISWAINAFKYLQLNWESITNSMLEATKKLGTFVKNVFGNIIEFFKNPFKFGLKFFNSISTKISDATGINMPALPELATGATNFSGGLALVGEKGPEIVSLPTGSNVVTNNNSASLATAAINTQNIKMEQLTRQEELVNKVIDIKSKEIEKKSNTNNAFNNVNQISSGTPVILQIDGREFARAVINVMDKNLKLNMVGI